MKKRRTKPNIPIILALVLLYLTIISTHLTAGLYARYVTRGSGSDSARVAKFDVVGTGNGEVIVKKESGENGQYTITVTNNSEVDVSYDVDLVFQAAIADWVNLELDGKYATETVEEGVTTFHFADVGAMDPQDSQTKIISFLAEAGMTKDMTGLHGSLGPMEFTVYIHAVQID